jgi:hypothetical protein
MCIVRPLALQLVVPRAACCNSHAVLDAAAQVGACSGCRLANATSLGDYQKRQGDGAA